METPEQIIKSAGLNYQWYVDEAKSIVRELEQGKKTNISEKYINEKIKKVQMLFTDMKQEITRQTLIKEQEEKNVKRWL